MIPEELVWPDSQIMLSFRKDVRDSKTEAVICFQGNRQGFLALANAILYCLASLRDEVDLADFPFVTHLGDIRLKIQIDSEAEGEVGAISTDDEKLFVWRIAEENLAAVASQSLHPLGYTTPEHRVDHVHIDEGMPAAGISIYCCVQT